MIFSEYFSNHLECLVSLPLSEQNRLLPHLIFLSHDESIRYHKHRPTVLILEDPFWINDTYTLMEHESFSTVHYILLGPSTSLNIDKCTISERWWFFRLTGLLCSYDTRDEKEPIWKGTKTPLSWDNLRHSLPRSQKIHDKSTVSRLCALQQPDLSFRRSFWNYLISWLYILWFFTKHKSEGCALDEWRNCVFSCRQFSGPFQSHIEVIEFGISFFLYTYLYLTRGCDRSLTPWRRTGAVSWQANFWLHAGPSLRYAHSCTLILLDSDEFGTGNVPC